MKENKINADLYIKSTLIIIIGTLLSKLSGFAREVIIGAKFGASYQLDAYLVAFTIPSVLLASIGAAISTTFIPLYNKIKLEKGNNESNHYFNNVANITLILTTIIAVFIIAFADILIPLIAPGFSGETLQLAIRVSRIISVQTLLLGISSAITALLQANNRFFAYSINALLQNIVIIVLLVCIYEVSAVMLSYITILGIVFSTLMLLYASKKTGISYKMHINLKDTYILEMGRLIIPVLIGVSVQQINVLIDRILASTLYEGSISALNYANKLNLFVYAVFSVSISTVVYPSFSKLFAEGRKAELGKTVENSIITIFLLVVPITVGAILLSQDIVSVIFKRGRFDQAAVDMTSIALIYYSIGMIGYALRDLLSRVFYAMCDTKTPMYNGMIAVFCNVVLNFILVNYMKHGGLALATSISAILSSVLLFRSMTRYTEHINFRRLLVSVIKICVSAGLMGVVLILLDNLLYSGIEITKIIELLKVSFLILIGFITYLLLVVAFKVDGVVELVSIIMQKLRKVFNK